jgi:type IV pilus assembly protein PilY1
MDIQLRKLSLTAIIAALVFSAGSARADDTDVYMNPGAGLPAGSEPMVMFSLDYRSNLGSAACNGSTCNTLIAEGYLSPTGPYTFFDVMKGALRKVFDPLEGVKVGLMLNHNNNNDCEGFGRTKCSNGGYITMGFEKFEANDANGAKAAFHNILDTMPTPQGNVSHSYQGKELFFEFFRYLTGQGVYNAHNGFTDYGTNNTFNLDADYPQLSWDAGVEAGSKIKPSYDSPLRNAGACAKVYTVTMRFQVSNQDADSDAAISSAVGSGGFGTYKKEFPDVIQYLNDVDLANGSFGTVPDLDDKQNVISFFIVDGTKVNTTTTSYARAGGTGVPLVLSENPDELVATLQDIFKQILSVSSTFVAASVPVNVFNRSEVTDNVYIALFQVDGQAKPYWVGNVKKLKLTGANDSSATSQLVDARGTPAIAGDGRIRFDALTYWTNPSSLPAPDLDAGEVAGRDGRSVARGGAGQNTPGFDSGSPQEANGLGGRTIYYDRTSSDLDPLNVDTTTATRVQADFGAASAAEAAELIAFSRGLDIDDLDGDMKTDEAREWIFGDALHSRPLPINYGGIKGHGDGDPAIYIAVASDDGMLRMIRNSMPGGVESGREAWAFMPRHSMAAQKTLRANGTGMGHPYTMDGAPVAFIQDKNHDGNINAADGDKVHIYVGMRRGGKTYYALDVTDPESPQLMWTIEKSGDFAELGYSFSNPRIGLVDTSSGPRPALLFAGGYDTNKDTRGVVGSNDSEGNAIYVVDAETGALIWKARGAIGGSSAKVYEHSSLVDSIPSTLTIGDTTGNGLIDRIVVGDTGGNVWRADISGDDVSEWKLSLLAALGRHGTASPSIATDRRFFHRPDLVPSKDSYGLFDGVLIGSGDRSDPLDTGGVTGDFFYMIKDRQTAAGSGVDTGIQHVDFGDVTSNCLQNGGGCVVNLASGWRLRLTEVGEKVLATALTVTGKVFFTTYMPQASGSASACSPSEGAGRLYAVNLQDATAVINYDTSDDDPSEPGVPSTISDRSVELRSGGIPAEVVSIPPNKILRPDLQIDDVDATTRWRTFWNLQEDADIPAPAANPN